MSGLEPRRLDIRQREQTVRALADIGLLIQSLHLRVVGVVTTPSAFAVLRLMTSSKLIGLLNRKVGGLRTFEYFVNIDRRAAELIKVVWCVR
jgi:hypothetical protein